jgi:hypothetical protein
LPQDDSNASAPAFGKAHAHDLHFRRKILQEIVGGRMESQRWRHKVNERRSLLQIDALKLTITNDLSALQLTANAEPIVCLLQRQMNVLAGF